MTAELRVFGIRHHGPGSARALLAALAGFAPDCVLVEGPPDADDLIRWLDHPALEMPVALIVYCPDEPQRGTFYPFADFSPEYQALRYALAAGATAGFMDLPRRHTLAAEAAPAMPPIEPFNEMARAAGRETYEAWWNEAVEQRRAPGDAFAAVIELTAELRRAAAVTAQDATDAARLLAEQREAAMRQRIRQARAAGHARIAAVCGAWHAPALVGALADDPAADAALLRDLPALTVDATWIPWTYGRLTRGSGYGAGVASPGWYDHLWAAAGEGLEPTGMSARWLSRVAGVLRDEGVDVSAGHVIEAVRLAEALAALRGRPFPTLPELDEAAESVLCGGNAEPMQLVRRRLVIGERMGAVPPEAPAVPLQRDLRAQQARLKLRPEPEPSTLKLDLRQENHLERSRLLHRLALLDIPWGAPLEAKGQPVGTFAELWQLQWRPDLALRVITAAMWGNTVRDAAAAFTADSAARAAALPELTALIDRAVMADLPEAIPAILERIDALSAQGSGRAHVVHLLATLPPLANALRYGGLRQTAEHLPQLRRVFDHLLTRACLGLPAVCASLDSDAAAEMIESISAVAAAVRLAGGEEPAERWRETLGELADRRGVHGAVAGRATRLLHDAGALRGDGVGLRLERALSGPSVTEARYSADWLDGFLRDSGLLLVHDTRLWAEVDGWLGKLASERFVEVLPLLRRTFSDFPEGVREQLQRRAGAFTADAAGPERRADFDTARAAAALGVVGRLLGVRLSQRGIAP